MGTFCGTWSYDRGIAHQHLQSHGQLPREGAGEQNAFHSCRVGPSPRLFLSSGYDRGGIANMDDIMFPITLH